MSVEIVGNPINPRGPRFDVGEPVQVTVPGNHKGKVGAVVEVIQSPSGDFIYRYRVRFPNGNVKTFFGFELQAHEEMTA